MWLVVHPSVPANSVAELVALARSAREPMPYASSGNGSIHQLTMELFKADTGVNFTHVPFKGAGQSVPAMIAGDVKLGFIGYPAAAGAIKSGRLRVLAFSMARRSRILADRLPAAAVPKVRHRRRSACSSPRHALRRRHRAVVDAVRRRAVSA
jgi:tripartite-type tricarboxylate transporter receptor subunit TctC